MYIYIFILTNNDSTDITDITRYMICQHRLTTIDSTFSDRGASRPALPGDSVPWDDHAAFSALLGTDGEQPLFFMVTNMLLNSYQWLFAVITGYQSNSICESNRALENG